MHPRIDYSLGSGHTAADYPTLDDRLAQARAVVETALDAYDAPVVLWTGGKDSTLLLWLVRQVATERGVPTPPVVFIDHFDHFTAEAAFVERWSKRWNLDLLVARNEELSVFEPGELVPVDALPRRARRELRTVLGYDRDEFVVSPDSPEGAHLLQTLVLSDLLRDHGFDGVFTGVRWDELPARSDETFFSPRHDAPVPHDRVHPLLALTERDVWDVTWGKLVPDVVEGYPLGHVPRDQQDLPPDITVTDLPVSQKYFEGYRSIGTASGSGRAGDRPAWVVAGDGSPERAGRAIETESRMRRLRDLGFM
ncbi:phosphoadenosine phosphosulfate reductase family protein [Haloarchaeobius sp. DFWS5]|uniref:phosphoadenosine phosphosulfate reductase family protein n=1 Tax=Haloarchaeobius sp. DFWS5 TaxID=3446114 RepID=UPI003EBA2E46